MKKASILTMLMLHYSSLVTGEKPPTVPVISRMTEKENVISPTPRSEQSE